MNISIFSFITCILWVNTMILLTIIICKSKTFFYNVGIYVTLAALSTCFIRAMLPFELAYSIVIPSSRILTRIYNILRTPLHNTDVLNILLFIWGAIASILLILLFVESTIFYIRLRSIPDIDKYDVKKIVTNINNKYGFKKEAKVYFCNNVFSPFVFGFIKPRIILPTIIYTEEDLYFILLHELMHWNKRDLWFKLIMRLECIIYWWNPLMYIMQSLLSHMLELRCDYNATKSFNEEMRIKYLNAILKTLEHSQISTSSSLVMSEFATKEFVKRLKQRFSMVLNKDTKKNNLYIYLFFILLLFSSFSFVIQPEYKDLPIDDVAETDVINFAINPNTSYIRKEDEVFYLYYFETCLTELTEELVIDLVSTGIKIE